MVKKTKNQNNKPVIFAENVQKLGIGYKEQKYTRNKQKKKFQYLNRKQYKRLAEDNGTPYLDGYTKIRKKFRDNGEMILSINDDYFDLYKKKRFLSHTTGYIRTGENLFVAMQKSFAWVILIPLLIGCILFGVMKTEPTIPNIQSWVPVIDENIGTTTETEEETKSSGISIFGFTEWTIPAGQTEDLAIPLRNPEGNPCYFTFEIKLRDTGEVLYTSKMVPPGEQIGKVNLTRALDQGDYPATIHITTNELETGRVMNSPEMQITIHVVG